MSDVKEFHSDPDTGEVYEVVGYRKRERPRLFVPEPHPDEGSLVQQSARDECDINRIVANYGRTGLIDHYAATSARQGDFVRAPDFHTAMNTVVEAQARFNSLPSSLRKRFGNDPAEFLEFMANPENLDEARKLGLVKPEASQGRASARETLDGTQASDAASAPSAPSEGAPKPSKSP